jgi:hypothetical protein
MGMDLYRGKDYFRWNAIPWCGILEVAMNYGWEPMGTGAPRGRLKKDWDGSCNYWGNEGQLFYARDAKNLATALELFLTTPEAIRLRKSKRQREVLAPGQKLRRYVERLTDTISGPAEKYKPDGHRAQHGLTAEQREYIKQFISFCRKGSFRIY